MTLSAIANLYWVEIGAATNQQHSLSFIVFFTIASGVHAFEYATRLFDGRDNDHVQDIFIGDESNALTGLNPELFTHFVWDNHLIFG
jgi:hypothetical protein